MSAGDYSDFKELTAPARRSRTPRSSAPYAVRRQPGLQLPLVPHTNVLRWEYKPGSALYVVWQQGREDVSEYGRFRFSQDFGGLFGTPANNVFLVKFSYWLNHVGGIGTGDWALVGSDSHPTSHNRSPLDSVNRRADA